MAAEIPHWQPEAQALIPHWGTTHPLKITECVPNILDTSGRPVLEIQDENPAGVPFEFRPSRFRDGRERTVMNVSALEAVTPHFGEALGLLSYIRATLHPYSKKPKIDELDDVLHTAMLLPNWLVLRTDNPLQSGHIPLDISALTTISRGFAIPFSKAGRRKIEKEYTGEYIPFSFPLDSAESFVDFIFKNGLLLSSRSPGESCPAPRRMITQGAEVLLSRPSERMDEMAERSELSADDIKRARKFGFAFNVATSEQNTYTRFKFPVSFDSILYMATHDIDDPMKLNDDTARLARALKQRFIHRFNTAERWANESLGRDPVQNKWKPTDFGDLYR